MKFVIVLCNQNILEFREVLKRKKPDKLLDAEIFLKEISYELISDSYYIGRTIRDTTDQPILNAAIASKVDIILTGDKDFLSLDMRRLQCMNVAQFVTAEKISFT